MPTRIKICGITRPQDAVLAAELGADAIGLNFVKGSRQIDLQQARGIISAIESIPIPPIIVALCSLPSSDAPASLSVGEVGGHLNVNRFQIYGHSQMVLLNDDESPPYWMVHPVADRESLTKLVAQLSIENLHPQAIVLDTASDKLGGTGQAFNWNWIAEARAAGELEGLPPIILAGGLTPENVAEAIRIARPYAVDVSSGVEVKGQPGVKDAIKLRDFIQAAKSAI